MVKDILCLKSLTEAFISNLAWRSLWQLSAAQTSPRREQWQTFCCKLPSSGELLNEVGCWKLFGFNPVSASLWLCRLLSILQSSAPPWWLSQPILWTSPSEVYYLLVALHDLFCSSRGDFTQHPGIGPFPVCEVIHILTVILYELWELRLDGVCVLWLDTVTQARPANGLDCIFSGFSLWDLLPTDQNPQESSPPHTI